MAYNVTIITYLGSNDVILFVSWHCFQDSGPKMAEIPKFMNNDTKMHFTGTSSFYQ